jgi:uncharacterized protein (TIGR02246 family)
MQKTSFVLGAACLLTGICLTFGGEDPAPPESKTAKESPPKATTKKVSKPAATADNAKPAAEEVAKGSPDEQAIRANVADFVKAYSANDAKKAAACFTTEAEYIEPRGAAIQGREAIEASLAAIFAAQPGCKAETAVDSIRIISPGVAVDDGVTKISQSEKGEAVPTFYTAVHVKAGEKWLIASIRDHDPKRHQSHEDQLARLDWLLGDWVDEDVHSVVSFDCEPCDNGKFLLRKFSMKMDGQETLSGSQRIGWDAVTGQLRTWIFDSEGGHAEGVWHQDGESWTLKSTGVTADGETASGTSVYTMVNGHTMKWQAIDHVIGGVALPDSPVFTLVRKLAPPKALTITIKPAK